MIGVGALLFVVVIVAIGVIAGHHHRQPLNNVVPSIGAARGLGATAVQHRTANRTTRHRLVGSMVGDSPVAISDRLRTWSDAGLITSQQEQAIEAFEAARATDIRDANPESPPVSSAPRRVPFVAEALGYLGGVLGIVGLLLLVGRYWSDMATPGRLALSGGGTLLLAAAGVLVHEHADTALQRLRWFLWVMSAAAGALTAGVFAHDVLDARAPWSVALACTAVATAQNGAFWAWRERPAQQLIALGAAVATVGLVVAQWWSEVPTGLAVMAAAVPLTLVGWFRLTPQPAITVAVGSVGALIGAIQVASGWERPGVALLAATAAALMLLAALPAGRGTRASRVTLTVVATIGLLQSVPAAIGTYAESAGLVTGLVVWATGCALATVGSRRWLRVPLAFELCGGVAIVGGVAITGAQSVAFATVFGLLTAVALIALGTVPGHVLMSLFGSAGLLVNVPWAITHFFPGEGRAPLLILASGAVIVAVAVWLARQGGRLRSELRR